MSLGALQMKRIHKGIALLLILAMTVSVTACSKHTPAVASGLVSSTSSELASSLDSGSTLGNLESSVSSQPSSSIASSSSTAASSAASSSSAKAKSSSAVASTKSSHITAAANTAPKGSGSASRNTGNTGAKAHGNTNVPAEKAQPAPTQKPNQPKTAYDKPYDATQIRNDMIAYGESKGMQLDTSLWVKSDYSSNASYNPPTNTVQDVCEGINFKQNNQDAIDDTICGAKAGEPSAKNSDIRFNIVLLPNSNAPGDYFIFVLYG